MPARRSDEQADISVLAFGRRDLWGGPYSPCFYDAVERRGVPVIEAMEAGRSLLRNATSHRILHIQWPHLLYAATDRWTSMRRLVTMIAVMCEMKRRGCRIVWTMHNIYPHDRCVMPLLDVLMRRFLVRAASRFFLHGEFARRQALQAFPAIRGRTTIIDFGDWNGCFPDTIARQDARATLALAEDDHVFLFLGQCRRYKNLQVLIETFARLPEKAVLIVAGRFRDSDLESSVRRAIGLCDRRVILDSSFVPHDAVQIYLRACDAVVAPYSEVLTSGTAVLAASFGRPMIAPAIGFLPDIVTPETGILYDRERADGLEAAMLTAMRTVFDERKIRAAAKQRSWQRSADTFIAACREIVTSAA